MNFYLPIDDATPEVAIDNLVSITPEETDTDPLASTQSSAQTTPSKKKYAGATGPRCFVKGCPNTTKKRDAEGLDISFHRFPRDQTTQENWIARCCAGDDAKLANRYICSVHFEDRCLSKQRKPGSKRKIVEGGVPTLFLPQLSPRADGSSSPIDVETSIEQDIEMVELSSDDDLGGVRSPVVANRLTTAEALAAVNALDTLRSQPTLSTPSQTSLKRGPKPKKSPVKIVNRKESSIESLTISDDECEEESFPPNISEHNYLELQDPLEDAHLSHKWKTFNEKTRRSNLRAYFSRIAGFLPSDLPKDSKRTILESALQYLEKIIKKNTVLAVEEEKLFQKHYKLRKTKSRLERVAKKLNVAIYL